jgi:hypothetical protein
MALFFAHHLLLMAGQLLVLTLLLGVGLLWAPQVRLARHLAWEIPFRVFLGLGPLIALAQVWHLFWPINPAFTLCCLALGGLGLFRGRSTFFPELRSHLGRYWGWPLWVGAFLSSALVANLSLGGELIYDTGLYHLPAIHWNWRHPIVLGLGNLHNRLAFNNAIFLIHAAMDCLVSLPLSLRILNASLLLAFVPPLGRAFVALFKLTPLKTDPLDLALVVLFPWLIITGADHAASVSPDWPTFMVCMLLGLVVFDQVTHNDARKPVMKSALPLGLFLAALGFAIKISGAVFSFFALLVLGIGAFRRQRPALREVLKWLVFPLLLVFFWLLRGAMLSGYPLYPSDLLAMPVSWKIPLVDVKLMQDTILAWGRDPTRAPAEVLADPHWFQLWLEHSLFKTRHTLRIVFLPLLIFLAGLFLVLARARRGKRSINGARLFGLALPPLLALLFWFFSAPSLRFGVPFLWILAAPIFALGIWAPQGWALLRKLLFGAVIVTLSLFFFRDLVWYMVKPGAVKALTEIPTPPLQTIALPDGTEVHLGKKDGRVYYAPLPNAQVIAPGLRLRRDGDLASGFTREK